MPVVHTQGLETQFVHLGQRGRDQRLAYALPIRERVNTLLRRGVAIAGGLGARKVGAGCHADKSGLDHAGGIGVERVAHDREHQRALCVGQTTSTGRKDQKKK